MGNQRKATRPDGKPNAGAYLARSQRPLEILFLLLPLIVFYEIGLLVFLRGDGAVLTNKAHEALLRIFEAFGLNGATLALPALSLPGVLLIVILLLWQTLARLPWEVDLKTVVIMAGESLALAVPLFVIAQVLALLFGVPDSPGVALAMVSPGEAEATIRSLPLFGQIAVSIGAGLYEELVFRMALIAVFHTLLVDALKWPERRSVVLAVAFAAIAFAIYHPLRDASGAFDTRRFVLLLVAGIYFGAVFATRGFGIVVGTHAAYDIAAILLPEG